MGGPGLVTGVPLPADDRPFDDTPIHTADLPDTPIRDRNVPAEAWVEAPDALLAAAEGIPSADGRPVRIAYKRRLGGWLVGALPDDRAIADGEAGGFVKVLTRPGSDHILGATIVGYHAGELINEFVIAMKHGLGLNKILGTIHIYPTLGESNKFLAGEWRKARKPEKLLALVERYHRFNRG